MELCASCVHYKVCLSIDDGIALCCSGGDGCEHYEMRKSIEKEGAIKVIEYLENNGLLNMTLQGVANLKKEIHIK